jgi:hypothetical protein
MKSHPQPVSPQLNLPLLDRAPAELSPNQRQELALALAELLISGAAPSLGVPRPIGGPNEFETHE